MMLRCYIFVGIAFAFVIVVGAVGQPSKCRPRLEHKETRKAAMAEQAKLKILRNFYGYTGPNLVIFGTNISVNLDAVAYPNLPFSPTAIKALADDLNAKLAAQVTGGSVERAAANKAFTTLCDALNDDANIVEIAVKNDLTALLATGYLPASNNHAKSPLDDTSITGLYNNGTTQLLLRLETVRNAKTYQVQLSTDGGKTWVEAGIPPTQARRIVLTGLIPGTSYMVRARAIGGSTGASAWTSPATIICT
jgi:hypothetical protein